jgi:hypothetical protein
LKALTQSDEHLLCGREAQVRQIVDNCVTGRLSVLTAESGLGTTSLLNAGAVPALKRAGFIVVVWREWQGRFFATQLREGIADAVRSEATPDFYAQGESISELLQTIHKRSGRRVALILDQFEDYVRCQAGSEISDAFDGELSRAVLSREGSFVISVQDHAVPAFERFGQHIPNLLGSALVLPPLSREAARAVVRNRIAEIEPAALEALIAAPVVAREPDQVHPFFLDLAIERLLSARKASPTHAKASPTHEIGDVDRMVLESLDGVFGELSKSHVELLFRWCNVLISPEKRRLAVTDKGLTEYAGKLNRFVLTLLPAATEAGILRSVDLPGAIRYEIARECLMPIVCDWRDRREAAILARRRANFRVRSLSIATVLILLLYVGWLLLTLKD